MDEFLPCNQPALDERHTTTRFVGKVTIVTGGANGIGLGTVARFLNDGANVAIFDVDEKAGTEAVEKTALSSGRKADFFKVDVSDKQQCVDTVEKVVAIYGSINYLVNSVAYFGSKGLNATKSDWERTMSVNVQSYSNMVQACYPYMKKVSGNGGGAAVVNVASISSFQAQPCRWTYSASKGAVLMMTRNMALDLSKDSIRVNSISPSWIWTRECKKAAVEIGKIAFQEKYVGPCHMTKRWGETSEMAAAIVFLCSRDAAFITGTNLAVDGGYGAMGPEGHGNPDIYDGTKEET